MTEADLGDEGGGGGCHAPQGFDPCQPKGSPFGTF